MKSNLSGSRVVLLSLLFCYACGESKNLLSEREVYNDQEATPQLASFAVLGESTLIDSLLVYGKILPKSVLEIKSPASGDVTEVRISAGDNIHENDLLMRLDDETQRLRLAKAKKAVEVAELAFKSDSLAYLGKLTDQIKKNLRLNSGLDLALLELQEALLALNQRSLLSPISGMVSEVEFFAGQRVSIGEPVATIMDVSEYHFEFEVFESDFEKVTPDTKIFIEIFSNKRSIQGTFDQASHKIDDNGFVKIRSNLGSHEWARPGSNAKGLVVIEKAKGLIIPSSAIVRKNGRPVCFIFQNGLAKWRYIQTGEKNATHTEVVQGLNLADTLIVSDVMQLAHESKVSLRK